MGETNFDIVNAGGGFSYNGTDLPLNEAVEKTVGTGKDFATLRLALDWVETVVCGSRGSITLTLDDGIHSIGEPSDFDSWNYTYFSVSNKTLVIKSATGAKAGCTITLPSTDDGDIYPPMFLAQHGATLTFTDVTISADAGSYPYPTHCSAIYVVAGGVLLMNNCDIDGGFDDALYLYSGGKATLTENAAKGFVIDSANRGIAAALGCSVFVDSSVTISNCTTGIAVANGAYVHTSATMTTNTADYNVPINEIQYGGEYITSGTAALTLKV